MGAKFGALQYKYAVAQFEALGTIRLMIAKVGDSKTKFGALGTKFGAQGTKFKATRTKFSVTGTNTVL